MPPDQAEELVGMRVGVLANIGETSAVMAINPALVDLSHAIAGGQVFNALRREAFQARQLRQYRLVKRLGAASVSAAR
jgi:hypothetical protein